MVRVAIDVVGVVQGVGFRPFVHRAATRHGLSGWVRNRAGGLRVEVEGSAEAVDAFLEVLRHDPPPTACVRRIDVAAVPPGGDLGFHILASVADSPPRPVLPADLAVCAECIAETESPAARRYRYPFTNCTRCGPRYTIIESLPYDRPRTTMRGFPLCNACAAEYRDPADRRFHAQPIACPACGPTLRLLAPGGEEIGSGEGALAPAIAGLLAGRILALKGLGGFQLAVDATNAAAVRRLRARKGRAEKPFAVLFASVAAVRAACVLSPEEEQTLRSPAAPIVIVERTPAARRGAPGVDDAVAPRNPRLGVMLPVTPLHRLLASAVARPLVCTSGNLSDEPMCADEGAALVRLGAVADLFLVHDRPIVRPVDDSVVRVGATGPEVLRRARGFAPLSLTLAEEAPRVLALGAQQKSTVALALGREVVVSQHLGDLHSPDGALLLERTVADLVRFLGAQPERVACDLHPDYVSTRLAERLATTWGVPLERVQHHHAHAAACIAEHGLAGPVLALVWDGAGLGPDGTLWGGEALIVDGAAMRRVAHLRPFALPGGERAMREPRRSALGLLHAVFGADAAAHVDGIFRPAETRILLAMLERQLHAPRTTSMGRLFDAVAALAGLHAEASFEGQAAMALEFVAEAAEETAARYPLPLRPGEPAVADWEPLVRALLDDRARGVAASVMAARFHAALADLAVEIAGRTGLARVVLSGGCFQNVLLARTVCARLVARGFAVHTPQRYPPNDGGIALGQAMVAAWRARERNDVSRHSG